MGGLGGLGGLVSLPRRLASQAGHGSRRTQPPATDAV